MSRTGPEEALLSIAVCAALHVRLLASFDGRDPTLPVLIAYRGRVYDVTNCFLWRHGRHFEHSAGRDLTAALRRAPHTEQLLERAPCVGILDKRGAK